MLTPAIAGSREVRFGHLRGLAAGGLEIAAVRHDVLSHQRGDAGEFLVRNDVPIGAKPCDDAVDVDRIPDEHGIREEAEATRLVHDFLVVPEAECALVGEEQPFGKRVTELAAVELKLNRPAERLLVNVAEDVDGLNEAAKSRERLGDPIGRAGIDEALHDDMRRREAGLERGGDADELVPLLDDDGDVDRIAQQRVERSIISTAVDPIKRLVGKVLEARHEVDSEQDAQAPQGFSESSGVGRVLTNLQNRVVLEDAVEDVIRLAWRAGDRARRIDAVLAGGVGIERDRSLVVAEVARIEGAEQAVAFDREALPV